MRQSEGLGHHVNQIPTTFLNLRQKGAEELKAQLRLVDAAEDD